MHLPTPFIDGVSIVLVGSFNPKIFQPAWLKAQDLVRASEADDAEIGILLPEIAVFRLGPFQFNVSLERFVASTADPAEFEALRDLTVSIFRLLTHTPIHKVGLNRDVHFAAAEKLDWSNYQQRLATNASWASALTAPIVNKLEVRGARVDASPGYVLVRTEPSAQSKGGIYMQINDHFDLEGDPVTVGARAAIKLVEEEFERSIARSNRIMEGFLGT